MSRAKVHPDGVNKVTYSIPDDLKDQLTELAWEKRVSQSEIVRLALTDYVKRNAKKEAVAV